VVALYVVAGYWSTASTCFANPAVAIARSLTNTFSGIRPMCPGSFWQRLLARCWQPGYCIGCSRRQASEFAQQNDFICILGSIRSMSTFFPERRILTETMLDQFWTNLTRVFGEEGARSLVQSINEQAEERRQRLGKPLSSEVKRSGGSDG
jgi:hypothetical protein